MKILALYEVLEEASAVIKEIFTTNRSQWENHMYKTAHSKIIVLSESEF